MKKTQTPLHKLQNRENKIGICNMCTQERELTVDHIFPANILIKWGLEWHSIHDEENFSLICKPCNLLKGDRFDFNNQKTIYLIKKYTDMLIMTYPVINKCEQCGYIDKITKKGLCIMCLNIWYNN